MEKKKIILVVEDEEKIARLLRSRLTAAGYDVGWVARGDQALKVARKSRPDLILLDVMLPNMDGYTIARLLKFDKKFKHIPIIMLTARRTPEDFLTGKEVHADLYITKPFNSATLLAAIEDQLKKSSGRKEFTEPRREPLWLDGMSIIPPS